MTNILKKISLLFCCSAVIAAVELTEAAEIVYRWTDNNGSIHYSPVKPYGVKYETINTSFSKTQRDMIEQSEREHHMREYEANRDKILAQQAKERNALVQRILVCFDILDDKQEYQKRRINDQAVKEKQSCDYKYNKDKQKALYDDCILQIENRKILGFNKLDDNFKNCYNNDTPPDVISEAMKKHLENKAIAQKQKNSKIRDNIRNNVK